MTAPLIAGSRVLKATLEANSAYCLLVAWSLPGNRTILKTFFEHVDQDVPFPYVIIQHIFGGDENITKQGSMRATYRVTLHTTDIGDAVAGANLISTALRGKTPVLVGTSLESNWRAVTTIEENLPIFERYQVQNLPVFYAGADYIVQLQF